MHPLSEWGEGALLAGSAVLEPSFNQARANIDAEIPDVTSLEQTIQATKDAWTEKVDRVVLESLTVNGRKVIAPLIWHEGSAVGGEIVFQMSDLVEEWDN
ncbi:hypothetical protein C0991_007415, partial [Blastosporella zonata]